MISIHRVRVHALTASFVLLFAGAASAAPGGNPSGTPCQPAIAPCTSVGLPVVHAPCGFGNCQPICSGGANDGANCDEDADCEPIGVCFGGICPPFNATCVNVQGSDACKIQCNDSADVDTGTSVSCGGKWGRLQAKLVSGLMICGVKEVSAISAAKPFTDDCVAGARAKFDAKAEKLEANGCGRQCMSPLTLRAQAEAFAVNSFSQTFCPVCGDDTVNGTLEECDGTDDAACDGLCTVDCTCP